MSERDELRADLLDDHGYCVNCGEDTEDCECAFDEFIDAILAAGWRKLVLDDATVERAARALIVSIWKIPIAWEIASQRERDGLTAHARITLAASMEAIK